MSVTCANTDDLSGLELGYDVPAFPGMAEAEIITPCLVIDLDAFERNIARMRDYLSDHQVRFRAHGKMHKASAIADYQISTGGACGICCQKISEAESFVRNGIEDVLITNQIRGTTRLRRLATLAGTARLLVCVDDPSNVEELSHAVMTAGTRLEVLVEIDCGAGRCGVAPGAPALALARAIDDAPGLSFAGLQAYHGRAQHMRDFSDRRAEIEAAVTQVSETITMLYGAGLSCDIVGGGGTGTYSLEASSGVYNELQCGSYAFMDADYGAIRAADGGGFRDFENALFVLTEVMSHSKPDRAICDAGLKALTLDSGLPKLFEDDLEVLGCSDEHAVIGDPECRLALGDKLRLIPGHCDPTCNLHDWYVGVRDGVVECIWPIDARGKVF